MDPRYRQRFNAAYTGQLFQSYEQDLSRRLDCQFLFRLAETPAFVPPELLEQLTRGAHEILDQLSDPSRIQRMKQAIPKRWDTPAMDRLPSFTQIDFAVVRDATGRLVPRLIELQGFPSLTALQVVLRDAWNDALASIGMGDDWSCWFSGLDRAGFLELAKRTIVADHDPSEVVLMDIDPPKQKTSPDFNATKVLFDVDAIDPRQLIKAGKKLFRDLNGRRVPVKRIYNRVVFDELERTPLTLPFSYNEELDVEWAPHPNWYWVWSKYSIPFLDHPLVPRATFLSDSIPADLSGYVLKPLFSFAGGGVNVEPTRADVDRVPADQRPFWCLQEKIEYAPAIEAVDGGGVKVEIRMMFLRPDEVSRPVLGQNLVRLSRGKMMGVAFNKDTPWTGSSIALF